MSERTPNTTSSAPGSPPGWAPPSTLQVAPPPTSPVTTPTVAAPSDPAMPAPTPPTMHLPASAPGTPWSATGAPAQQPVPLEPAAPPKKSRGPLWAVIAAVAVIAVGIGAFFAFAGGSSGDDGSTIEVAGPEDPSADAFSFAQATVTASEAQAMRFDMTMNVPLLGEMVIDGAIDTPSKRMSMTMTLPGLDELDGGFDNQFDDGDTSDVDDGFVDDGSFGPQRIEMVIDGEGLVAYMKDPSGFLGGGDGVWVSMDLGEMAQLEGLSVEDFQDSFLTNPADLAEVFDGVDAVDVGMETIDGQAVKHYEVTVALKDVIESNPQLAEQFETSGLEVADVEMFEQIAYDVWVTEDNRLRRMALELDVDGMQMSMVMNITEIADSIDIPLPAPTDVESLDNIWGDLGAFED